MTIAKIKKAKQTQWNADSFLLVPGAWDDLWCPVISLGTRLRIHPWFVPPRTNFPIDQVQKHSETALGTLIFLGIKSSFPVKVHAVSGRTPAICKTYVVQKPKANCKSLLFRDLRFAWNEGFWIGWYSILATNWLVGSYVQFAKNARSCDAIRWPKVTNAKSLRENEGYCLLVISRRYQVL